MNTRNHTEHAEPSNEAVDAIMLLKQDHREVEAMFERYKQTRDKRQQGAIVREICTALEAHTRIEEKVFYPAAKAYDSLADLVNEAVVEHSGAKKLIRELRRSSPSDELYDARVNVLEEYIRHHVKEEEEELFPRVQQTDLDLADLGERLMGAKERALKAA